MTSTHGSAARLAEPALVAIAAVWGLTFVMVQDAIERLPVMAFLAYRFIPASLLVGLIFRRRLAALSREGWRAGTVLGLLLLAGYTTQTLGLERTTASDAGFITGLCVVLTPLFGAMFLGQRAGRMAWVAALVAAAGLFLLSGAQGEFRLRGDGLLLACAVVFAWHILAIARYVRVYSVEALLAVQLGVCGLGSLGIAAIAGQVATPRGATVWSALAVTALVASALAFFVQSHAQRVAPPARTALILASEPAFAGLFGWLLNDERLSPVQWLGAGLILLAIVAMSAMPRLRRPVVLPEG